MGHGFRRVVLMVLFCLITLLSKASIVRSQASLTPDGPWMVYTTNDSDALSDRTRDILWAANADGSAPTQISSGKQIVSLAVSPAGHDVTYVTTDGASYADENVVLNWVSLPDTTSKVLTPLTGLQMRTTNGYRNPAMEAILRDQDNMAWSPDGNWLAFVGAEAGPSADVYVYNKATQKIKQVTSGPSQAVNLSWSPDSKYIAHFGVIDFGTGAGGSLAGAWAVSADGSDLRTLYQPKGGNERVEAWLDPVTMVVGSWDAQCGWHNLRTLNLNTLAMNTLVKGYYNSVGYAPSAKQFLFSADFSIECPDTPDTGLFTLKVGEAKPHKTADKGGAVAWVPAANLFTLNQNHFVNDPQKSKYPILVTSMSTVSPDGKITYLPLSASAYPVIGPDSEHAAWVANTVDRELSLGGLYDTATTPTDIKYVMTLLWVR